MSRRKLGVPDFRSNERECRQPWLGAAQGIQRRGRPHRPCARERHGVAGRRCASASRDGAVYQRRVFCRGRRVLNGIAINNPEVVLPRNEPYPLKTGDKICIDEYEIVVTASAAAPAEPAPAHVAGTRRAPPGAAVERRGIGPSRRFSVSPMTLRRISIRCKLMGGAWRGIRALQRRDRQGPLSASWNHTSSLSDHFSPPAANTVPGAGAGNPAGAGSGNVIPENWDRTRSIGRSCGRIASRRRRLLRPRLGAGLTAATTAAGAAQQIVTVLAAAATTAVVVPAAADSGTTASAAAEHVAPTNTSEAHLDRKAFCGGERRSGPRAS